MATEQKLRGEPTLNHLLSWLREKEQRAFVLSQEMGLSPDTRVLYAENELMFRKARALLTTEQGAPTGEGVANSILKRLVHVYNTVDESNHGFLEHQKQKYVYRKLRPITQEAYEYLKPLPAPPVVETADEERNET